MSIGGVYCLLTDTAGLRSHGDVGVGAIEIEGMKRAR
jgi:tRNA U34 5-carboxymethylaminomethyl modifying GTPase MnmE/TrmE